MDHNPMNDTVPTSSNPDDYTYAVKVDDDEALSLKAELDDKARVGRRLQTQLDIVKAEQTALKERLFLRLEDLYPGMSSLDPDGGVAVRVWQNNLYYVAWEPQSKR